MFAKVTTFLASSKLKIGRGLLTFIEAQVSLLVSTQKEALYSIGGQQTGYNDRHDVDAPETVSPQSRFDAWIHVLLRLNYPSSRKLVCLYSPPNPP